MILVKKSKIFVEKSFIYINIDKKNNNLNFISRIKYYLNFNLNFL